MLVRHFIRARRRDRARAAGLAAVALLTVAATASSLAQQAAAPASTFVVFVRGERIGSEDVTLARTADGWTITSSGRFGPPIDLVVKELQARYSGEWRPIDLRIDAITGTQPLTLRTVVTDTSATTTVTQAGQSDARTDTIAPDSILLPSPFWGPFEALSQKLRDAAAGATLQSYSGGTVVPIEVGNSVSELIQTASRLITARRTALKLLTPSAAPLELEVWGDETGRLLRVSVPAQNLEVAREDVASVAARRVTMARANDEQVRVPANGFSLAGTISKPASAAGRLPSIILVAGSGPQDRDETVYGIPIFGQLADRLADAGFLVLRYDKRGVGQSGGRIESATLVDYADDLRAAVRFLSDRKDVDRRQLTLVGHSEGGSVAMIAAAKEKRVGALVLISTIGVTGAELNMTQVTQGLERSKRPAEERVATIELQKKIQTAVLTGKGWEEVPPNLRKQAEIPWFKSFLAFDPAKVMSDVRQPLLVIHGLLDTQVDPSNADLLEKMARARKKAGPIEVVKIPGVNHLLVPATTGEVDEYASLKERVVSDQVSNAVITWSKKTLAAAR
jgi:pimeloyl-ACP methyl ester carboxylesterase